MKIGLVGWGIETQSAYRYFGSNHSYIICNEHEDESLPAHSNVTLSTNHVTRDHGDAGSSKDLSYLKPLDECELIIYSPVSWNNLKVAFAGQEDFLSRCKTVQHIFFEKADQTRIIAITGTKGKSTVADVCARMLEAAGKTVFLGGNIGIGSLDFLDEFNSDLDSICVLELSSYQLNNLTLSPRVAVLLAITPEHLDWHGTFDRYASAKANITIHQSASCTLIYDQRNKVACGIADKSSANKVGFPNAKSPIRGTEEPNPENKILFKSGETVETFIRGKHNMYNLEAASLACSVFSDDFQIFGEVARNYRGLSHRLETVDTINGVTYINDSIASTPEASLAGIDSFSEPVVLLIGGHDRGLDIQEYCRHIKERLGHLRQVIIFGEVANRLSSTLKDYSVPHLKVDGMENIVNLASECAKSGDVVLLSPGFSSYDSYLKFSFRGDDFKNYVRKLAPTNDR